MKRLLLPIVLLLLSVGNLSAQDQHGVLRFRADSTFRIAQFTDLHIDPTSANTPRTYEVLREVIRSERPDLVLLTGDAITERPAAEGWRTLTRFFGEEKQPYGVLLGNHDAEVISKDSIYDLLEGKPYCISLRGPRTIEGKGNQEIRIESSSGGEIAALLYLLDSGQYYRDQFISHYDHIHFDQIDWLRRTHAQTISESGRESIPSMLFFHIPISEFETLKDQRKGHISEGISSSTLNSGLFSTLLDLGGVMGVFCGHDHANDALAIRDGVTLGYGRVSGLDAYGDLPRGGRMIVLHEGEQRFDSWIATPERGREATFYYPSGFDSDEEQSAHYLPALSLDARTHGVRYLYYTGTIKQTEQIPTATLIKEGTLPYLSIEGADREDHFGYIFESLIRIPERGLYRFYTYSDDGSVLYIDGVKVVDNDGGHSARLREGVVALEAGFHRLRVDYFEDYMGQTLEVGLTGKSLLRQPIPESMLYLEPSDE